MHWQIVFHGGLGASKFTPVLFSFSFESSHTHKITLSIFRGCSPALILAKAAQTLTISQHRSASMSKPVVSMAPMNRPVLPASSVQQIEDSSRESTSGNSRRGRRMEQMQASTSTKAATFWRCGLQVRRSRGVQVRSRKCKYELRVE